MRTLRLIVRMFSITLIIAGFYSCKKDKDDNKKKCNGEDFICTYKYSNGTSFAYRYCQDGWVAYYAYGEFKNVFYDSDYTDNWNDLKEEWMDDDASDSELKCVF